MNVDLSAFELDHVSVSQLRTFYMCGIRWYFDNANPERVYAPGWSARLRGTSIDRAATEHFQKKANDGTGITLNQFVDLAVATHQEGEDTHMFEMSEVSSRDRTALLAKEYRQTFGEMFHPWAEQAVQEKIKYESPDLLLPVHGVIDITLVTNMVVDTKVRAKKNVPKQAAVDRDLQLTTYSMMKGTQDVGLAIVTDEKHPEAIFIPARRTADQVGNIKQRYNEMIRSIQAGILHPAPEGSWYCCQKWCAYWSMCSYGGAEEMEIPGLEV